MGAQNSAPANGLPALGPWKKIIPHGQIFDHMQGGRQADGQPLGLGFGAGRMQRFSAFGQQVKTGAVIVIAMGHLDGGWGGGCGRDPGDSGQVELAQRLFQVIIDLAVVKTVGGFDPFAGRVDLCNGQGGRADID